MEKKFLDKQGLMVLNEGLGTKFVSQANEKTMLKELQDDISHRTVTDEEKERWNKVDNKVDKTVLSDYAKKTDLDNKVDKVNGKALSTNDYTDADKTKLQTMPVPTFLEKEQYNSLSEQEKIDSNKIYYIYAEKQE